MPVNCVQNFFSANGRQSYINIICELYIRYEQV